MGSLIKFFVFLLGLVGLSASKKRKEEVKKIDKKVKQNKKQVKASKKKVSTAKKVSKKKTDSIKKTEAKKKQIKEKFTEENDNEGDVALTLPSDNAPQTRLRSEFLRSLGVFL